MIPKLKKTKEEKSKLKVKKKRAKYAWEEKKEGKPRVVDWSKYIKVKVPVIPIKYTEFKGKVFGSGGGKKYGFAKVVKVKKSNRKHTAHLLRLSTERQLDPKPAMILSSENYDFETAMEKIKSLHEKRGQQKVAYLEIYCSYESESLLREYLKELSEKFQSEVFAIIHTDESVPHCHILVSWANKEGKAIRLKQGDFKRLWATTIQRLQPSRLVPSKKGEGLPKVPYWAYRKAWLQGGQEEYENFCMEQWERWKLFYKWLNELHNWEVEPPFRRKFFKLWLEEEGYIQPEPKETINPFEILKELTSKLASSPQGDVLQAEGLRDFTTPTEALETNEVVIGGGVDAQQLVVHPEVVVAKEEMEEEMVAIEDRFEDKMVAMKVEPLEVRTESKVSLATRKEPLESKEDKEDKRDKDRTERKEPVVLAKKEPKVVAKKETEESKEKERIEEKVVLAKEPREDRKELKEERTEKVAITKGDSGWTEDLWDIMKELNKREKEKKKQIKKLEEALFRSFDKVKTKRKTFKGIK